MDEVVVRVSVIHELSNGSSSEVFSDTPLIQLFLVCGLTGSCQ
jgi:hypothetical protein